jgi:hypothetical protein
MVLFIENLERKYYRKCNEISCNIKQTSIKNRKRDQGFKEKDKQGLEAI